MAQGYLVTARYALREAQAAYTEKMWHMTLRRAQESTEMALKAALRLVGLEVPKVHDVGFFLRENRALFPGWFQEHIDRLARTSRGLRKDREASIYGDESLGLPPQAIFSQADADEAVNEATYVLKQVRCLFQERCE
jgi:HEPN domain-containing protein